MLLRLAPFSLVLVAALGVSAEAQAGRKIRLMYEPPAPAAALTTPVTVTFEDLRDAKKGGDEPNLIAQERNNLGMPMGIFSGAQDTQDPPALVPIWVVDTLKAAGYLAATGEPGENPRVHVILRNLWGDG